MTSNRSSRGKSVATSPRTFGLSPEDLRALGYGAVKTEDDDPREPAPPRRRDPVRRMWAFTLSLLLFVGWASSTGRSRPAPVPGDAPDTAFSAGRAAVDLAGIIGRPHVAGSREHDRMRDHLLHRLRALGLETEVHTETVATRDSGVVHAATVRHVVARLPGLASTGAILLTAPYDTPPRSFGVDGGGVGVAATLEALRSVVSKGPLRNDIIVLFSDGQALGDAAARAFAERHAWMSEVALLVSVSMGSAQGPVILFDRGRETGRLVEESGRVGVRAVMTSLATTSWGQRTPGAKPEGFRNQGARAFVMTTSIDASAPRTAADLSRRVVERTLQQAGDNLVGLMHHFGEARLDSREALSGPDRAYFTLPMVGLVHYPAAWGLPLTLGLLGIWLLLIRLSKPREAMAWGIGIGLAVAILSVGASALVGRLLLETLRGLHPEYGSLATAFYRDGPPTLAVAALAVACVSVTYALAGRWFRKGHVILGALTVPMVLCAWLTLAAPGAAPAVQWSLACALLAAALLMAMEAGRARSHWTWAPTVALSGGVLALVIPSAQLLAGAWTFRAAASLGGLFAIVSLMLLPAIDRLLRPRAWWLPTAGVAVAGALVALTLPVVQGGRAHPMPTSLTYLTDGLPRDAVRKITGFSAREGSRNVRRVQGRWLTVPGPGEAWARSWVGEPVHGSTDPGVLLLAGEPWELIGTGPDTEIEGPELTVLESWADGTTRRMEVAVRSGLRGEMVGLHLPVGVEGEFTSVGGTTWEGGAVPVRSLVHWGRPEEGDLRVGLVVGASAGNRHLQVIEHHLRPREVLGDYFFQRADSIVPNGAVGTDRVIQRTRVPLAERGVALSLPPGLPSSGGP